MYTRSRQSLNFTGGTPQRAQNAGGNQPQQQQFAGQGQNTPYNQQGNYQGNNQNQQNVYKQGQGNSTPLKQQPQQQQQVQTPQQQRTPQVKQQPLNQQVQQPLNQQVQQPLIQQVQQPLNQQVQQPLNQQVQQQQAQRLKPILKSASASPQPIQAQNQNVNQQIAQPQSNNGMDTGDEVKICSDNEDSDVQEIPKWKRKVPGLKVNRKLKRLRLNQRLRKTLQPKNAIMVLNEMKTGVQFTFPETQSSMTNSLFLVHAEIEGKTYIGQGISKPLARQNAAENALKSLLLEKMTAAAMKARLDAENGVAGSAPPADNKEGEVNMETTPVEETDEIPWSSLASFALYKLFLEWQNQGTVVPVPRPGVSTGKVKKETTKTLAPKELPPNAITIHPVMLLNQMRPGLVYHEISRVGNPPNIMFTLAVELDGQQYTGSAKNKKDAKKVTAKNALNALYNLVYPEEEKEEDVTMG